MLNKLDIPHGLFALKVNPEGDHGYFVNVNVVIFISGFSLQAIDDTECRFQLPLLLKPVVMYADL